MPKKKALRKAGPPLEFGNRRRERERGKHASTPREVKSHVCLCPRKCIYLHTCMRTADIQKYGEIVRSACRQTDGR